MAVLEDLTEEEAYLFAIFQDKSGIDMSEFCWYEPNSPNGVWRAFPHQWKWFHNNDIYQIDQCGRGVGKSESIRLRAFAFPFIHPNQEMMITAPELNHLERITRLVETQIMAVKFTHNMLAKVGGKGSITHRPLQIDFANGSRIMGRIPQRDGKGMKGVHPLWLEMDEGQDFPAEGFLETIETLRAGEKGAMWRIHGVTRGVRDHFYKFTQPDSGWTVHRITAMHMPSWSDAERKAKVEMYEGKDSPDYRRNILGLHGDATSPLFVLTRLMKVIDRDEDSDYNRSEYQYIRINDEQIRDNGNDIEMLLDLPLNHQNSKVQYWLGADIGYTNHPTEILAFAEHRDKKSPSWLKLMARIHLDRVSHGDQVAAILWLTRFYNAQAFSMDKTGLGLPLFQDLQERAPNLSERIKGYNFSAKIVVDFDKTKEVDEHIGNELEDTIIEQNVLERATDVLRGLVDAERILLPWDRDLIGQFQGQTYTTAKAGLDLYGRRRLYSQGQFHALDAARMAALGWSQHPIEELIGNQKQRDVLDVFVY